MCLQLESFWMTWCIVFLADNIVQNNIYHLTIKTPMVAHTNNWLHTVKFWHPHKLWHSCWQKSFHKAYTWYYGILPCHFTLYRVDFIFCSLSCLWLIISMKDRLSESNYQGIVCSFILGPLYDYKNKSRQNL